MRSSRALPHADRRGDEMTGTPDRAIHRANRNLRLSTVLTIALSLPAIGTARAGTSGGLCLRDAAGLTQANICTANDVRIGHFDVIGTCSSSGTQNGKPCISRNASDPCVLQGGTCVAVKSCV